MCILFSFDDFFLTTRRRIGIDCDSCRWSEAESRPTDTSLHRLFVFTEPRFCQLGRVYVMQASPYSRHWPERHRPTRDYRWWSRCFHVAADDGFWGGGSTAAASALGPHSMVLCASWRSPLAPWSVSTSRPARPATAAWLRGITDPSEETPVRSTGRCRFGMYGSCQQGIHQLTNWKEVRSPVSLVLLIFYFFEKLHVTLFCSCFWNWCWKHHPVASWRMLHNEEFDQSIAKKVACGEFLKKMKKKRK